ncbi:MAG: glycoside hydrolase family 44 protein [Myxococcaceae bacterium]
MTKAMYAVAVLVACACGGTAGLTGAEEVGSDNTTSAARSGDGSPAGAGGGVASGVRPDGGPWDGPRGGGAGFGGGSSVGGNPGTGGGIAADAGNATGGGSAVGGGSASGGGAATGGGPAVMITPGDPGSADVQLEVHSDQNARPISPLIYGSNVADDIANSRYGLVRAGGNRYTAYNWENNASNAGSDWLYQNDDNLSASNTPGAALAPLLQSAAAHGAATLLTVPIVDYVAADKNGGGDVRNSGSNYLSTRFKQNRATKGSALSTTPDATDGYVNQDEFVSWVTANYGSQQVLFSMDNEPDLWSSTHAEIHPNSVGYDELCQRNITYATMVKSIAPNALVLGSVNYGWGGFDNLSGAPDMSGKGNYLDYYLTQMQAAQTSAGKRLIDVLDLHWYPEAQGGGQRIIGTATDVASVQARVQAPRSLWDPTYVETSWITQTTNNQAIQLIPWANAKIAAHYPGTGLSFSEWNYGAGDDISGGVATADVLGIFGREGVAAATLWPLNGNEVFNLAAFHAYRNYDGNGAGFEDTSVQATTSDVATATVYGSLHSTDPSKMVIVAINKSATAKSAGLKVYSTAQFSKLKVYTVTSASASVVPGSDAPAVGVNAFDYTMPPMSVSVLVPAP